MIGSIQRENIDEAYEAEGYAPRNIEGRLREWARARWYPPVNSWPPESPMYAVLNAPGRATNGSQDGGMAGRAWVHARALEREIRVIEITKAIQLLPGHARDLIRHMYEVSQRERPRSERSVADHFGMSREECSKHLQRAYGWLERELCMTSVPELVMRQSMCG